MKPWLVLALGLSASLLAGCDECYTDFDCRGGGVCSFEGACVGCQLDSDCEPGSECDGVECVPRTCRADYECGPGRSCASGRCAPAAPTCGDFICGRGESCSACPRDCGACPSGTCAQVSPRAFSGANVCLPVPELAQEVVNSLVTVWGTQPSLFCRYDSLTTSGQNACGPLAPRNALYCGLDDMIAYDAQLLNQQHVNLGTFAPVSVLAHEWGHLHQARAGLLGPGRSTFQNEQHADCQAGIFAAIAQELGWIGPMDVDAAFAALCQASDGAWHPNGHGTCAQRANAFMHGYRAAQLEIDAVCVPDPVGAALQICRN